MTKLYGRKIAVNFVAPDGHAIDMSDLHCQFSVRQWETMSPNVCDLRIFNVKNDSAIRIGTDKEFSRLVLQAGYATGQFGTIFDGSIVQTRRGRVTPADTYIDVTAYDADLAHNFAVVNQTLAAGATPDTIHQCLLHSMAPYGVTQGFTATLPGPALPRGRAMYGMTRDHLRDLADNTDCSWNVRDGQLYFVSHTGYMPGEAVVLTSATGLIGLPQQTQDGILARCLLNPLLRVNNKVQIDNTSIQQARIDPTFAGANPIQQMRLPTLNETDGVYRVLALDHNGDTRGTAWYTEITCISVDGTIPLSQIPRGRGGDTAPTAGGSTSPLPAATPIVSGGTTS